MIGKLRHRVTFQQESGADDGAGGTTVTWSDLATTPTVWAQIEPLSARERMQAAKLEHQITHRIKIRHRSDLNTKMRVQYGSRLFNIRGIINVEERDQFTILTVQEGVEQ